MRLDGRLAIVTGGGGTLGAVAAMAFAEAGADVVVVARTLAKCEAVAQKVRDRGRRSLALSVDVLAQAQLDGMVERIMGEWGRIDILFNNAGTSSPHAMLESGVEEWCRVIDVNIKGYFPVHAGGGPGDDRAGSRAHHQHGVDHGQGRHGKP